MFSLQSMFVKKDKIITLLQASSEAALESAQAAHELTCGDSETVAFMATFSAARRREKGLAAQISEDLVNTFVTSLDREDLEAMNSSLYRIPKTVEKFAARYMLVAEHLEGVDFSQRTGILAASTEVVVEMVRELRKGMRIGPMRKLQERLQALEGEADELLLEPYSGFYVNDPDPIRVMLAKDLFEILEKAIDVCRDVGNVIYSVVLKNS